MGVPIPTIPGDRAGCRATASLLHHSGFAELVAASPAEYVELVTQLATDTNRLSALRSTIRPQMLETVCNGKRFARDLESKLGEFWQTYRATTQSVEQS